MVFHHGWILFILLHCIEVDLSCKVVDNILSWSDDCCGVWVSVVIPILVLQVVHTIVGVLIEDVISVCCGCILRETDTTGHVGTEPDLVKEHGTCTDNLKGCTGGVIWIFPVCLDNIGEDTEFDTTGLIWTTCTACRKDGCHL